MKKKASKSKGKGATRTSRIVLDTDNVVCDVAIVMAGTGHAKHVDVSGHMTFHVGAPSTTSASAMVGPGLDDLLAHLARSFLEHRAIHSAHPEPAPQESANGTHAHDHATDDEHYHDGEEQPS